MFWKTSILEADVIKLVVKLTKHWTLKCMVFNSEATFYSFFFPGKWICLSHLYYMMEMGGLKPKRPAPRIWSRYHARHGRGSNPNSFFFRIVDGYIVIVLLFQRYTCYILLYCCTMPPTWGIVGTYHVYIIVDSMNVVLYILILRDGISLFHTYIYIYSYIYIHIFIYIYSYIV